MFIFMRRRVLPASLLAALAGCASLSADQGFGDVSEIAGQRLRQTPERPRSEAELGETRQLIDKLLQKPLSVDDAVQIALLGNRGLQADYEELGIVEANLVQASRLPNPGFSFGRTRSGDDIKIDRSFSMAVMGLLTLPATSKIERRQFQIAKLSAAAASCRSPLRPVPPTTKAWRQRRACATRSKSKALQPLAANWRSRWRRPAISTSWN
ncbi:putative rND efflux system outer membrane lipoprotein [Collimonas arenae]|uniref:hypothetical protein n=1 Tax=Collimonas arenae TaxID=279058 RepID=UPI00078B626C|nr:putative rND efflux system outer membrane lipoprotein [Collimonas arenae]